MPEEINRVLTDHLSSILLCPSKIAVENLAKEDIRNGVHEVGDVMYDALLFFRERAGNESKVLDRLSLKRNGYLLATVHRAENTDNPTRLKSIVEALCALSKSESVVFPVHPRTRKQIEKYDIPIKKNNLLAIEPQGYLDMLELEQSSRMILTDSGGIQKEAYWLNIPCLTLRDETEWPETTHGGWNVLVGADENKIIAAAHHFSPPTEHPDLYGDGMATHHIKKVLESYPIATWELPEFPSVS
jgi:UDP-N-acetylglucosamine 2-epimerase